MLRSIALFLLALPLVAWAELQWENPVQEFRCKPEDAQVEARFKFKNAGSSPVTIQQIQSSCGCTTAALEKKSYAASESGAITAKFTFGGRTGEQQKAISVSTDDGKVQPLTLRVWIQEQFTLKPLLVFWRIGEASDPKIVQLAAADGSKVHIKAIASPNPRIRAELETVKPGEQYLIRVTPTDTQQIEAADISVQTDAPAQAPKTYTIFARIR